MQMKLMLAISVLAGLFAAGLVWFGWELMIKINGNKKKVAEGDALLATAKEPKTEDRPK
jgi:hypothetical protein